MRQRHMPLGYRMAGGKIVIDPEQAEIIKGIFQEYSEGASLSSLRENLRNRERSMQTISRYGIMGRLEKSWRTESIWETKFIRRYWNRSCLIRCRSTEKKKAEDWGALCSLTA